MKSKYLDHFELFSVANFRTFFKINKSNNTKFSKEVCMQPFLSLISKEKAQEQALMAGCFSLKSIRVNKQIFIINLPAHTPVPRGLVGVVFCAGSIC